MACHKGRKPPPYTLEPRTPEKDASAVTASRSLPTRRHEAGQNRGGATPSPVRGSCTVILGRAHRRTAQLAVACMCGQLPHGIPGARNTLRISRSGVEESGPGLPSVRCSSNRLLGNVPQAPPPRTPIRPFTSSHFPIRASCDAPPTPRLCPPPAPPRNPSPLHREGCPEFLAPCSFAGYHVPGRDNSGEGTSRGTFRASVPMPDH